MRHGQNREDGFAASSSLSLLVPYSALHAPLHRQARVGLRMFRGGVAIWDDPASAVTRGKAGAERKCPRKACWKDAMAIHPCKDLDTGRCTVVSSRVHMDPSR